MGAHECRLYRIQNNNTQSSECSRTGLFKYRTPISIYMRALLSALTLALLYFIYRFYREKCEYMKTRYLIAPTTQFIKTHLVCPNTWYYAWFNTDDNNTCTIGIQNVYGVFHLHFTPVYRIRLFTSPRTIDQRVPIVLCILSDVLTVPVHILSVSKFFSNRAIHDANNSMYVHSCKCIHKNVLRLTYSI